MMNHYGVEEWTDFVRGLVRDENQRPMREHLAECEECASKARLLEKVTLAARSDSQLEPLDAAVRSVKAYFTVRQPSGTRRFKPLGLEIAFDSLLLPQVAGARSGAAATRQLVCYASDYALTVRLDQEAKDLHLDGEILSRQSGPLADVRAFLLSRDEVLSQAVSGELGEFDLRATNGDQLRLSVVIDDERCLEVELDPPAASALDQADNVIQASRRAAGDWGPQWSGADNSGREH